MTLILTEVSKYGVAMAADSALTSADGRSFYGAQKLLPIPQLNAGISIWGNYNIANTYADVWTQNFITNDVNPNATLWDTANLLAEKLNNTFGTVIQERMGFHISGYDTKDGIRGPAFYHVHNGHYHWELGFGEIREVPDEYPKIREFKANEDHAPKIYNETESQLTSNGDFTIFSHLYRSIKPKVEDELKGLSGFEFPYPSSLSTRGEYLRFWIKLIAELYRLSNFRLRILPQPATSGETSIGGPITILTISDKGIQSFYTR